MTKRSSSNLYDEGSLPFYYGTWEQPEELFQMIARSRSGKQILERFLPLFYAGKVEFIVSSQRELKKLAAQQVLKGTAAAAFTYQQGRRRIHFEKGKTLGLMVPVLTHEIVHSIDERFLNLDSNKSLQHRVLEDKAKQLLKTLSEKLNKNPEDLTGAHCSPSERLMLKDLKAAKLAHEKQHYLRAETHAYQLQFKVTEELMLKYPGYYEYLTRMENDFGYILTRAVSSDEIREAYSL